MTEGSKPRAPAGCVLTVTVWLGESSPGCTYMHREHPRNAAELHSQEPVREGQSWRQLCETRRNIFTFCVKKTGKAGDTRGGRERQEKNSLTVFRGPALFFFFSFFFSSCSPRLLFVHHNPPVHPSAGHFLRHGAWSILMLRDDVLGMKRKHVTPLAQEADNHARTQFQPFLHSARLHVADCYLSVPLTHSLPPFILLKFSMYALSPSNVSLPPLSLSLPFSIALSSSLPRDTCWMQKLSYGMIFLSLPKHCFIICPIHFVFHLMHPFSFSLFTMLKDPFPSLPPLAIISSSFSLFCLSFTHLCICLLFLPASPFIFSVSPLKSDRTSTSVSPQASSEGNEQK